MPDMMQAMPMQQPSAELVYIGDQQQFGKAKTKLLEMAKETNLAENMDEDELKKIGNRVVDDYGIDEESRKEWLEKHKEAIKLANQVREEKTFPWPNAANIKLPLIADASIKFAARAYSEIVKGDKVVKAEVIGPDPDGAKELTAKRVSSYMSWQLLKRMKEWESDTDKLLHILPVVGHVFRKAYYSPRLKRNITELIMPDKLCINNTAPNLQAARRATHILENTHKNTIISNQRSGVWRDVNFDQMSPDQVQGEPETDKYYTFLEQHTYLDLDDDGYEEPYIITVEKSSRTVMRIVSNYEEQDILENQKGEIQNIEPCQYFASYPFIPAFDGSFYGTGFGILLSPLNETANTLFNQLLDAGTMSVTAGGFLSKEIKVKAGIYRFAPNEWKKTEATAEQIQKGIAPLPVREPSNVLFSLLGMVIEMAKDLASVKDVLGGDLPAQSTQATTVLALIEQGMKTFNAIYKRFYRSLTDEFTIMYKLNYRYADEEEYYKVLDQDAKVYREDFNGKNCDIYPVADPNISSDMQRMAKVQAMQEMIGMPGVNPKPILAYKLDALQVSEKQIAEILPEQDPNGNPQAMAMQHEAEMKLADVHNKERELDIRERELALKEKMAEYQATLQIAQANQANAAAGATTMGAQVSAVQAATDSIHREVEMNIEQQLAQDQMQHEKDMAQQQAGQQAQQPQGAPQ